MSPRNLLAAVALLATAALPVLAGPLDVGAPAPEARPKVMLQGEAITKLDDSKTYLFEFWATWCGPCVAQVPHLDHLHRTFGPKGLVVLATSVWEDDQAKPAAFVKGKGDKMSYRVGFDADKAMAKNWLEAAGVNGIPHAFAVQKGKIIWQGHPGTLTDALVASMLDGSYSPEKAEQAAKAEEAKQVAMMEKFNALGEALQAKQWDKAEKLLTEVLPLVPESERADFTEGVRDQIALGKGDPSGIYKRIAKYAEENKEDGEQQNEIAWDLATNPIFEGKRNLELAEKCAQIAVKLASGNDKAASLDTLARIKFLQGKKDEAIKLQQQAVELADEDMKPEVQATLDSLKKGILPKVETQGEIIDEDEMK